jgi:hypothetical protein
MNNRGKISLHHYSNIYSKEPEITWLSFLLWTRGGLHITVPFFIDAHILDKRTRLNRHQGTMLKVLLYADLLVSRAKKKAMLFQVL